MIDNKVVMKMALDALRNHSGNYKLNRKECLAHQAVEDALIGAIAQPEQTSTLLFGTQEQRMDLLKKSTTHTTEQNFCPQCGKQIIGIDDVHRCTPPAYKETN